ncbi:P-loop containing nucleoside triphosphate hydrolase [Raphidocelis subcapitata]|uniref:P-loop containing nucleoside triphosphate hydrolase n=1 Tax=Raphidocelis subcapitata TaxID=307507 RepID=A0A2V0NPX5_9CHLO|nr:P-loop containing nucleoside triphosphate hydrolase [Raphidocelis subcapitata]|eukprot:GBF89691.1 P-loop containing nucleoside triphosphate hydrolase [Raphidocelis subcapitata]
MASTSAAGAAASSGLVDATTQVSRFHAETLTQVTNGLDLPGVQLAVDFKALLEDAHIQLRPGSRYGLIGRNGVGKSTLLRVMGERTLIGMPSNLRVCYVAQEASGSTERTVLEEVLAVDPQGAALDRQIADLEAALDSGDAATIAAAVAAANAGRAAAEADAAEAIAYKRSGLRGLRARQAAIETQAKARAAAATAAAAAARAARGGGGSASDDGSGGGSDGDSSEAGDEASEQLPPPTLEEAEEAAHELLNELYEAQAEADPDEARARAASILAGLGFDAARQAGPTAALSGGWRMRLALAAALFARPDLLLLDEPTNHLDLEAALWLGAHLSGPACEGLTLVVVSHDRAFLDAVAQDTIVFKDKQLRYWTGNYTAFVAARAAAHAAKATKIAALEKKKKHIEDSIQEQNRKARQAGDDKQLKQAASRRKKLEERFGSDKTENGRRFKLSKHGYFGMSKRPPVVMEQLEKPVEFRLPEPEPIRYSGPLLQLRSVSFRYPGAPSAALRAVTLDVPMGARLALLGPNGAGKSTLLRLIAGTARPTPAGDDDDGGGAGGGGGAARAVGAQGPSKRAAAAARGLAITAAAVPTAKAAAAAVGGAGSVERHANLEIGLFGQHTVEELDLESNALERATAIVPSLREQDARDFLGSFGLGGRLATQPLRTLSGGQRSRAALCFVLLRRPHVLCLDEPTNHLDLDATEGLARALRAYPGAVVLASHDVRFVDEVLGTGDDPVTGGVTGGVTPEIYVVGGGGAKKWTKGGAAEYAATRLEKMQRAAAAGGGGSGGGGARRGG